MKKSLAVLLFAVSFLSYANAGVLKESYKVAKVGSFPFRHPVTFSKHVSLYHGAKAAGRAGREELELASYPVRHPVKSAKAVKRFAY